MTKVSVKNGEFVWPSPLTRARFMERAEGKDVELEVDEKPSDELYKYFEACLVPAFFYMHPHSDWASFADAREVLKVEFSPFTKQIQGIDGSFVKVAPSTRSLSKTRFNAFVEAVVEWMTENGIPFEILDSEAYKVWRDTNFSDPIYPPLGRMKEAYERARSTQ